jgi:two-component system, chemotaxis family, protein-glutamate methylesterase/glutaminase
MSNPAYIIVTGTSAGGLRALSEMVAHLDPNMDAAVFIVLHLARTAVSDFLLLRLQPLTALKCKIAEDDAYIERGTIYIAPANGHLLIEKDQVKIGYGPEEGRWRPSIDALFRSAAASWSNRVIGIVLTGMLNDGTVGMMAIKKSGGTSIVQDPNEAEFPEMPLSVLDSMEVDHCVPLANMGGLLNEITAAPLTEQVEAPPEVITEAEIAANVMLGYDNVEKLGQKSKYACPDCGGGLYNIEESNGSTRYRCHIGHAYTEDALSEKQNETLESTLWIALRIMEERKNLLVKMARTNAAKSFKTWANTYTQKAAELDVHIGQLKEVLFSTQQHAGVQ